MSTIIGHRDVLSRIEVEKPPVSIFLGPESVGKWTAAEYLRGVWRVDEGDTLRVPNLTMDAARDVVQFSSVAPSASPKRLVIIRIPSVSTPSGEVLLKTLEEGTETTDFILIAQTATAVVPTLWSRATVYQFGFLTEEDVASVLLGRNFQDGEARRLAALAGGQIRRALSVVNSRDLKSVVLLVLKAFRELDTTALEAAASKWTDDHTSLLAQWCQESITGRWRVFLPEESGIQGRAVPLKILLALNSDVRPKLLVRSNLMLALKGA